MKTSTEQLKELLEQIRSLNKTIESINWTQAEIDDPKMGEHMSKVEHYLDCALGRTSTVIDRSRALSRQPGAIKNGDDTIAIRRDKFTA